MSAFQGVSFCIWRDAAWHGHGRQQKHPVSDVSSGCRSRDGGSRTCAGWRASMHVWALRSMVSTYAWDGMGLADRPSLQPALTFAEP